MGPSARGGCHPVSCRGLQLFVVAVLRGPPGHSTRCVCGATSAGCSLPPVAVYKMQQQRVPTRPTCWKKQIMAYFRQEMCTRLLILASQCNSDSLVPCKNHYFKETPHLLTSIHTLPDWWGAELDWDMPFLFEGKDVHRLAYKKIIIFV